ncbi:MAG: hypothetical protein RL371_204, partial [Bacteroidota bacterium]
ILKDLVVDPTVVKTVSKTRVSVEKVRFDLDRSTCLLHELKVPQKSKQQATRKPNKIRICSTTYKATDYWPLNPILNKNVLWLVLVWG